MTDSFADKLRQLSAAEDFLNFFGVPYDKAVVNVSRLHILKRFYQYIRQEPNLPENNEQALFQCYRQLLVKAYEDFVKSTPAQEKVFKVFQEAEGHQHVTLQNLKSTLPSHGGAVPSFTVPAAPRAA
ncbi:MAG: nitrogenase stabilizing/protective protein NifW [Aquabacterium sp.]|uniref:nitrogenase stabilizing/protective protein NifW n=1 Tax=Aquabacterium sp. TaxID=1872578 RepID=UPI0011F54A2C|nr:nitrogenase stabilizing/protective protein NifW [Aquabacterium sp.]TAK86736.1 MAG: nitrogenase stabilizing/protective protein NifW [Aquabacterium sp.]